MAAYAAAKLEVELVAGTWTDLASGGSQDVIGPVRVRYGIQGNGPADSVAGTGEMIWSLKNGPNSSGGRSYYSPLSASVRTGWTYGVGCRLVLTDPADSAQSITGITRSGAVATATKVAHGYSTDDWLTIAGAGQAEYNGTHKITVTGADTFTYPVSGTPATPATGTITAIRSYVKFRGKVRVITPSGGLQRDQRCDVVAYDYMRDLMEADVREIDIAIGDSEDTLIGDVLDAIPSDAQPLYRDLDAGVDTFPYAFWNVQGGDKAGGLVKDITITAVGISAIKGDGTFIYRSRHSRATGSSVFTLSNNMTEIAAPSSLEKVYNRVRVTIHPMTVDAAATTVIYAATGTPPSIPAGQSLTIWGDFRDPANVLKLIGATAAVEALVAGTDYAGNAAADGSGADLTASLAIVATAFASTVKFVIANNHATATIHLVTTGGVTKLQIRGKGIYDNGPQTFEAYVAKDYGDRPFAFDMPYQDDPEIGQSAATYIEAQYDDLDDQLDAVAFVASDTQALLTQALARDIGDQITVTETQTGVTSVRAIIHRVELELLGRNIWCRWGFAPAAPFAVWQLGVAGASELGTSTVLGF